MARQDRPAHHEPVCGLCDGFGQMRKWVSRQHRERLCLFGHGTRSQFTPVCKDFRSTRTMIACPDEGLKTMDYCSLNCSSRLCPNQECPMPKIAASYLHEHPGRRLPEYVPSKKVQQLGKGW